MPWGIGIMLRAHAWALQDSYERWCDGLIAQERRLVDRERARIGHTRVDRPWRAFRNDPRCAPGVLLWFDAHEAPAMIGTGEDLDEFDYRAWVRELVDARPALTRLALPSSARSWTPSALRTLKRHAERLVAAANNAIADVMEHGEAIVALALPTEHDPTGSAWRRAANVTGDPEPPVRFCTRCREDVVDGVCACAIRVTHGDVTREMIERATPEELIAGARFVARPPSDRALAAVANGCIVPDVQARAHTQQAALRDIGAALGVEGEPLSAVVTAAWEHAGYRLGRPPTDAVRGLVALSCALTTPQAEHPDVRAACAWIAGVSPLAHTSAPRPDDTPIPFIVTERPWVPSPGEIFHGHVRGVWYRMEWRGWYDFAGPGGAHRASVRPVDRGPGPGDTLDDMRPIDRAPASTPPDIYFTVSGDSWPCTLFQADERLAHGEGPFLVLSSGSLPAGLAVATPYWVISLGRYFQLAAGEASAYARIPVDITAPGSGLHRLQRAAALPGGAA